ncbi:MAG TPA: 1-deoxy-D-xylulose-5-phosphate reductoisomerase [Gemmatimonadales bacterium]
MTIGVAILGSTGSIGTSALRVLARHRDQFRVLALTANDSADLLERQARETCAEFVGLVRARGEACLVEAATHPGVHIVINAVVGAAGLPATLAALDAGRRVALANKETLVMAGDLVQERARRGGGEIVPVDSEHSAVLQCLAGAGAATLRRLILTASGGPFRDWPAERVSRATVEQALNHPTWRMGRKVTVDSATLVNKALEVIEAHFLFGLSYDAIDVVVHPQSIVHAMTEFADGSILAQMGFPTMELPILYALTHPRRLPDQGVTRFDPLTAGPLTFEPVRDDVFPAFRLGVMAGARGGLAPAVFNAANEVAVDAFLEGRIAFGRIADAIQRALDRHQDDGRPALDLATVLEADGRARAEAEAACC